MNEVSGQFVQSVKIRPVPFEQSLNSLYFSRKPPTYPSPKPTLRATCGLVRRRGGGGCSKWVVISVYMGIRKSCIHGYTEVFIKA